MLGFFAYNWKKSERQEGGTSAVVSLINVNIKGNDKKCTMSLGSLQLLLRTSTTEGICLLLRGGKKSQKSQEKYETLWSNTHTCPVKKAEHQKFSLEIKG